MNLYASLNGPSIRGYYFTIRLSFVLVCSSSVSSSANINSRSLPRTGDTCLQRGYILGIIIFAVQQYLFSKASSIVLGNDRESWRNQGKRARTYVKSSGGRDKISRGINSFSSSKERWNDSRVIETC